MSGHLILILALGCALAGCTRAPVAQESTAPHLLSVACGTADSAGSVPRGHTVYANGDVVRWNGRSVTSGGTSIGTATERARDSLWSATQLLIASESETGSVLGRLQFLDVETADGIQRYARAAGSGSDERFAVAFRACMDAVGSSE